MSIDFSSAIDNARLIAAREEALRRNAEHALAVQLKSSRWSALSKSTRSVARSRPSSAALAKATPAGHAH